MAEDKNSKVTQNQDRINKLIDGLTLFDDDLMSRVFDKNIEATELLLRIILERKIKVISVIGQEEMKKDFGEYLSEGGEAEEDEWALRLDVDSKGRCLPTINNAKIILANDRALKGKIRKNEFTKKYRVFGETPWEKEKKERDWTDADDAGLRHYMEKIYQIKGKSTIEDAWTLVANENRYHPVREYLEGLVWDGVPRLETLLIEYQGAEDSRYTREVTKKALVAAVARIFVPGIKYATFVFIRRTR